MVNTNVPRAGHVLDLLSGAVQARLVNRGRDTKLLFGDGSTILLKGISRPDAVLPRDGSEAAPVGREIRENGEGAHHRRDGGEGLRRVGE